MSGIVLLVAAFVVMEGVSYAAHRWVMHGVGMGWHRSHHAPAAAPLERNDLFPACFSVVGIALFAAGALTGDTAWTWVAGGVTLYGAAYLFVHEVYIHRRLAPPLPRWRYLEWLRTAHAAHHTGGGEPYGMLLPVRRGADGRGQVPLERAVPRATRSSRARL